MRYFHITNDELQLLRGLIESAPDAGYTLPDIRAACRVLDALPEDDGLAALEDADWSFAVKRFEAAKFRVALPLIADFFDRMSKAPSTQAAHDDAA